MNLGFLIALSPKLQFLAASIVSLAVFFSLWFLLFRSLDPQATYEMEPKGRSFEPLLSRYFDIAKVAISLAVGSIALLTGYVGFVMQSKPELLPAVQGAVAWPLPLLAFSVLYGVFFLVSLARSFETYLHFPDSYTRFWYSLNQALGFSGLICFALGYLTLAITVVLIL